MNWSTFYQNNHEIIIGGLFTILGIFIGWLLNLIQFYFQNKHENTIYLREKKEEVYKIMLSDQFRNNVYNLEVDLEKLYPLINMYASKSVIDLFRVSVKTKKLLMN